MKIAIAELLAAIDLAAAKTLGQQQFNLQYAGLNLGSKNQKESAALEISGNTLLIEPQILQSDNSRVALKITVRQKDSSGGISLLLATQLSFVRMPVGNLFAANTPGQSFAFSSYSAN